MPTRKKKIVKKSIMKPNDSFEKEYIRTIEKDTTIYNLQLFNSTKQCHIKLR